MGETGEAGNVLRSRGYRVRITAAAPNLTAIRGGGAGRAPVDHGAHLDRLPAPECWRAVAGWDGYEVSDRGRVRTRRHRARAKLLRLHANHRGYLRVWLHGASGVRRQARVHVLVAAAFVGVIPAGHTVDHLDRDKRNNRAGNLEIVSRLENYRRHLRRAREALEDVLDLFAAPVRQAVAR